MQTSITLFTIPQAFEDNRIQWNAIKSWTLLNPKPDIFLLGNASGVASITNELGLYQIPNIEQNSSISDIAKWLDRIINNTILVYINPSVILTEDFALTIQEVYNNQDNFFLTGQYKTVQTEAVINFNDNQWQHQLRVMADKQSLPQGQLQNIYLVFTKQLLQQLFVLDPNIDSSWEQQLLYAALRKYYPIIDGSSIITAFLQIPPDSASLASINLKQANNYRQWVEKYDTLSPRQCQQISQKIQRWQQKRLFSIIMPVYNTNEKWLRIAIESVCKQLYPYWELCIADDASTKAHIRSTLEEFAQLDKRIKVLFRKKKGHISAASNSALAIATGEFIALLDHDDKLPVHAFYQIAELLNQYPDTDLIYSDEDKIDEFEQRYGAYFKSDWNPDLFYSHNLISHLGVYRRTIVNEIGGFRLGYEGSQDYDLALRVIERTNRIRHIPHVLYHWRAIAGSTALDNQEKPYAPIAARKAIQSHFDRLQKSVKVVEAEVGGYSRVIYPLPKQLPLVSLIIPTRDRLDLLHSIVDGILNKTDYQNIELIIIDNGSVENKTLDYFERLNLEARVKIIQHDAPFNYSELNNIGVARSFGEIIGLLNNDLEVISSAWLTEMLSHALRPEIGIVGAKLWYPKETLQHGGVVMGLGGLAKHAHNGLPRGQAGYFGRAVLIQNFSAVTGACMVMRKTVFNAVGGLNEKNLAITYNDVDLCLKVNELGLRIVWTPYAELYHHESASRGYADTPEKQARYHKECDYIKSRWSHFIKSDPAYSPNLTLDREDFSLAFPPRVPK